jgi:hypothetical protein
LKTRYGYYGGKGPSADVVEEAYKRQQHYRRTSYDSDEDYYGYNK